ncbi:hypothetical protein ASPACDRAFT_115135 [Aspergillus aculeatus ATCC 16872]|uniref:Rhodopsin domain-containing protein n=1 Tax=Aspergillus aculeatus (strain ATCC 16872 / CBS 172.66 / WB 5094) TaxID=690307 RepID=A0A1L9X1T9_ASPA1|nr:uncharacterized protein ASPACDRAFT_115135 [Aspergillus aculeatus ATCC 16872]OJK02346.1 hypothetical protein ASPACDRAFT_115135 [Aspergillus aculeatus ATCC 16872]
MSSDSSSNAGPALLSGLWAAVGITTFILVLRIAAKIKIRHFHIDDVLMIAALILTLSSMGLLTNSVRHGFGKDLRSLELSDTEAVLKDIAIQVPLVTFSTGFARSSFVLYLLGILGGKKPYQIALWTAMMLQLVCNIIAAVLPLSICRNVRALWIPGTETTCGNTVAVIRFAYFQSSINTATDLFLAVFPTVIFWNLNLKLRIKISLIILLSLGIVAMIASIIKTTKLDQVPSVTDIGASGGVELIRWGYTENVIIIMTSSIPCIRPLLISSVRKFSSNAKSRSYELTGPFSGNKGNTKNGTAPSQNQERRDDDADSVEQILREAYQQNSALEAGRGIKKQVDISVVSDGSSFGR